MEFITLEVDGRRHELVAGLVWHPLQGTGAARAREINAFARDSDADLKVLRGDDTAHVGLARRSDGARAGQVAAAAVIADALAQEGHRSVLAALRLPEAQGKLLYLAMRDGVILADGDSVSDEAEIRSRLTADRAYGGWDQVLCPPEWALPATVPRTLESFLSGKLLGRSKRWQLQELRLNLSRLALTSAVVAGIAAAGIWAWRTYRDQQQITEALALAQRQQAERASDERVRQAATTTVPPWPLLPRPTDFARACLAAFERTGSVAGNWKFEGAVCEAGQLTVRWTKASEAAWVSHLIALRPRAVIAADGLSAMVSTEALAPVTPEPKEELLQQTRFLRLRYLDIASRFGMTIRLDPVQPSPAPMQLPGQMPAAAPAPPPWAETNVQANVTFDPIEAARLLEAPGLRFRRMVFAFGRDGIPQYQFSGVQYVLP